LAVSIKQQDRSISVVSIFVSGALRAIAAGWRLPELQRVANFRQQSRTQDALARAGVNVAIDAGANAGFYAQHLRMSGFTGYILSFEPEPRTFRLLQERAAGDKKWLTYNCALGDAEDDLPFHVVLAGSETVLSSLLRPTVHETEEVVSVPVRRLDSYAEEIRQLVREPRIFLKMDTQGYDLKIFAGATSIDPWIRVVQSEVSVQPIYHGMPHYTESMQVFEGSDFHLLDLFVVNRDSSGAVAEYDALMARS
jgi:FkbM family methyltransferase